MDNSNLEANKSLTNYFLKRLLVSFILIYLIGIPFFEFLGFFRVLILITATLMNVFLGIAVIAEGLRSQKYYPKIVALLCLIFYGQFYFNNIFSKMWEDFYSFHFASFGSLILIIPTIYILKDLQLLINGEYIEHKDFDIKYFSRLPYIVGVIVWLIFGHLTFLRVKDGFTDPKVIANRIYKEASWSYRIGAYCEDGTKSFATGRGACSWHGGVDEWIHETKYKKTKEACLKEAYEISWLE
jgi:hypothetical protein